MNKNPNVNMKKYKTSKLHKQKKYENMKFANKLLSLIKLIILISIIVGIPLYLLIFKQDILKELKDIEHIMEVLKNYKETSMFIYVGIQVTQIVVSFIPGQAFQMAAGYLYGIFLATILSIIGAMIGTTISFYLSKFLGKDFQYIVFGEEKMEKYMNLLSSHKGYTTVLLLYLIPGVPKDMVSYAAGVSNISFRIFLILSTIGRLPGMIGSMLIGVFLKEKNYVALGIIIFLAIASFILCIIYRKKINNYMDDIYIKMDSKVGR